MLAAVICLGALQIFADDAAALQVGCHLSHAIAVLLHAVNTYMLTIQYLYAFIAAAYTDFVSHTRTCTSNAGCDASRVV